MLRNKSMQLLCLAVFVLVTFSLRESNNLIVVSGDSMCPTYINGEYLRVEEPVKDALTRGFPVCWVEVPDGTNVIKRLIGCPGQCVELIDGATYVDGQLIMEAVGDSREDALFLLEDDQYLFLGDNRPYSIDGRFWYPSYVSFSNIKGVVPDSELRR